MKISALPDASGLDGSEEIPLVQGGATKKATAADVGALAVGNGAARDDLTNVAAADFGDKTYDAAQVAVTNLVTPTARADSTRWATRKAVAGLDFSLPSDVSDDSAGPINTLILALGERGGGIIDLASVPQIGVDSAIDNYVPGVMLVGAFRDTFHDVADLARTTTIVPRFSGGAVLKRRSPYGLMLPKTFGGGFMDLRVIGNGVATRLLEIDSVEHVRIDLFLQDCVGSEAAYMTCGVTGTDFAEQADCSQNRIDLRISQISSVATQSCHGLVLDGNLTADTCYDEIYVEMQHYDGRVVWMKCCDNNRLRRVIGYLASGGAGHLLYASGPTASSLGGNFNIIEYISGAGAIYAEGTDTFGVTSGACNIIEVRDAANGTPAPTAGTGSFWWDLENRYGTMTRPRSVQALFALHDYEAATDAPNVGNESLRVFNSAADHMRFTDGTSVWGININNANGNLRLQRMSGTGVVDIGSGGAGCMIDGKLVIEGAADSGGTGFKMLLVAN